MPCIASNVGGNRAILVDGETGLLFEPGDVGGLAAGLEQALAQPDLARRLSAAAREAVVERYDLARLVTGEIELLRRVARP